MFHAVCTNIILKRFNLLFNGNLIFTKTIKSQSLLFNSKKIPDVKGFSDAVLKVPESPVGYAGASKNSEYKNPEYFCYHVDSFGNSMVELDKYRLPAPSNKKK